MSIQWWQILLLTLYAAYQILDELTIVSSAGSAIFAGLVSGLVMGDLGVGLTIGASMQLTVLGVGTFGGASRIDANSGTVLATAFAVASGMKADTAVATIGVSVATLMVYTDVLGRFLTTYFAHRIDTHVENFNYKAIERNYLLGALPWALSRALPVFLALAFGEGAVKALVDLLQNDLKWLGDGLQLAGKMLPGVGFAILLRYLPVKKHFPYLILGFTLTALLTTIFSNISSIAGTVGKLVPALKGIIKEDAVSALAGNFNGLPMLAVALIGFALAATHFKQNMAAPKVASVASSNGEEIEDDEI